MAPKMTGTCTKCGKTVAIGTREWSEHKCGESMTKTIPLVQFQVIMRRRGVEDRPTIFALDADGNMWYKEDYSNWVPLTNPAREE